MISAKEMRDISDSNRDVIEKRAEEFVDMALAQCHEASEDGLHECVVSYKIKRKNWSRSWQESLYEAAHQLREEGYSCSVSYGDETGDIMAGPGEEDTYLLAISW